LRHFVAEPLICGISDADEAVYVHKPKLWTLYKLSRSTDFPTYNTIVTWRLKAGIVEPEETSIATQRLGKQVSAANGTQATIEELLGTMSSIRSVLSAYKEEFSWESVVEFRCYKWTISRKKSEKMPLCAQLAVGPWREDFTCAVIQWDSYSSRVKIRYQETDSGD
jgi:hypothetical protein